MKTHKVTEKPKPGDLQVWWIPQIPMNNPFTVKVKTIEEAKLLLDTLARYDLYQYKNKIKPDYSNAGGLSIWSEDKDIDGTPDWIDWEDEDGYDIDQHFENLKG